MNICFQKNGFREIIYNAIQHKIFYTGIPIQISVYNDKIYVWNDGELPKNITKENLFKKHASKPSNPKIAQTFFKAGFVEAWGRGFEKIKEECERNNTPIPEVMENTGGVMIKCYPSKKYMELFKKLNENNVQINVHKNVQINQNKKLTKVENKILQIIIENPNITQVNIAKEIDTTTKTVQRAIAKLKNNEIIKRVGSNKKGYWEIK